MRRIAVAPMQDEKLPLPETVDTDGISELKPPPYNNVANLDLENILKPYFWTLRLGGVYYGPGDDKCSGKASLSCIYCVLVNLFLLLNTGRLCFIIPSLRSLDDAVSQGIPLIWHIYILLFSLSMLHYCMTKSGWKTFFAEYRNMLELTCSPDKVKFKSTCRVYVIVAWITALANASFCAYLSFTTNAFDIMCMPFSKDEPAGFWMRVVGVVGTTYSSIIFTSSITHVLLVSHLLGLIFKTLNDTFRGYSQQCPLRFSEIFQSVKEFHQCLCGLVDSADTLVSVMMGIDVIFNLVLTCGVAYSVIYNPFNLTTIIFYTICAFWMVACLSAILVPSALAAWMHEQAHGAFDVLQDVKVRHVTDNLTLQMTLFASKLSGTLIAFSVGKMFALDKNAIMTFVGLLLTYFFLLVQFRPSSTAPVCDCTSWLANLTLQCTSNI